MAGGTATSCVISLAPIPASRPRCSTFRRFSSTGSAIPSAGALKEGRVRFFEQDFLQADPGFLASFDLVIMNENLGDFPTLAGIKRKFFYSPWKDLDGNLAAARELFLKYNLDIPQSCPFNLNAGALQAVEILCSSGAARIFLSEHSCEAGAHATGSGGFPGENKTQGT